MRQWVHDTCIEVAWARYADHLWGGSLLKIWDPPCGSLNFGDLVYVSFPTISWITAYTKVVNPIQPTADHSLIAEKRVVSIKHGCRKAQPARKFWRNVFGIYLQIRLLYPTPYR